MTALDFLAAHPFIACALILASGSALGSALAAPAKALAAWRRPGDCPRCNGSGREPLK